MIHGTVVGKFEGFEEIVKNKTGGGTFSINVMSVQIQTGYDTKVKDTTFPFQVFGKGLEIAKNQLKYMQEVEVQFELDAYKTFQNVKAIIVKPGNESNDIPF